MQGTVDRILELCGTIHCQTALERELQDAIEHLLRPSFPSLTREAKLGPGDVVDFFLPIDGVAVEIKVKGSPMSVIRQIQRYARHPEVKEVVLVTTRSAHRSLPGELRGKPVHVAWLPPF